MPSSPKVQKETILQTAYELLLRDGYGGINIKTVANELGCSTQPISRQFGSMEVFRQELLLYCLDRMKTFFHSEGENAATIVTGIAKAYISLAYDYPNLYKYLYMSEHENENMRTTVEALRSHSYEIIIAMLKEEHDMPEFYAKEYMNNLNFYVHGMASYAAVGFSAESKENAMIKVQRVSDALLRNWREPKGE